MSQINLTKMSHLEFVELLQVRGSSLVKSISKTSKKK